MFVSANKKRGIFYVAAVAATPRKTHVAAAPNQYTADLFVITTDGVTPRYEVVPVEVVGLVRIVKKNRRYVMLNLEPWNVVAEVIVTL